jgi:hypothetical protein
LTLASFAAIFFDIINIHLFDQTRTSCKRSLLVLTAAVAFASLGVSAVFAQISKGHQILIDRGLQLQGLSQDDVYLHLDTFSNANYTSINWINSVSNSTSSAHSSRPDWMGDPPGYLWSRWAWDETQMPPQITPYGGDETPYLSQLFALQLGDELNLNDDTIRTRLVDWFNAVRANWPYVILYHNNWGSQIADDKLFDFYTRAQPDMLCFDTYPWQSVWDINATDHIGAPISGPPTGWYGDLRRYREHARGAGIPLGIYRQTFHAVQDYDQHVFRDPSKSELRLNTFGALAFNVKLFTDFVYNTGAASLFTKTFNGSGDSVISTNGLYAEMADVNLRARNFGKTLVRLTPITNEAFVGYTTSMMFIRGKDSGGNPTTVPVGFLADAQDPNLYTEWAYQRNDPYLTNNWVVTNKGTKNNGQPGDVIIAWFKPLDESFDGPDYTNELYMMVVNGLTDPTGTAADCRQEIQLNFRDGFLALEMLDPLSGNVQVQPLPLTNGLRRLTLTLNGGDGALFKFSDGAPFVGGQVVGPPVITLQPASRTNNAGDSATFTALAAGSAPLSYRWQFNGSDIAGATTNTLTKPGLLPTDGGNYRLIVTNSLGSATSVVATLTVFSAPLISAQPQSQTVNAGSNVLFTVGATGTPTPGYQWRFNGYDIFGATSSSYVRANVQSGDAGNYTVVASNSLGFAVSSNAVLTVNGPPSITTQPHDTATLTGGGASFSVTAVGAGPLVFRWRKNSLNLFDGSNISGATTATLTINNVQAADLGTYSVTVSNGFAGVLSSSAILSIATTPAIQIQPQSITNNFGTTAYFSVVASGNGLTYQWQRNGTNLSDNANVLGSTTSTLVLPAVTRLDASTYTVVITNAAGNVTSDPASLAVVYALPLVEPFAYAAAVNLGGQTSPDLLTWADVGTSTAGPFVTVRAGNLDVSGLVRSTGNSILFGGLGKSARLPLPTGKAVNSGTLYFSCAFKVLDLTGASPSGGFIAGFNNSVGTQTGQPSVVGTRLYLRTSGTGFNLGVAKNSSTTSDWVWDNTVYVTNQTIFLVGSYTFTSVAVTNDDIARLWINPSPTNFSAPNPPPAGLTATTGPDITADQIASFVFFQRSATVEPAAMVADEFRLDTTWAGVTPAYPKPANLSIQWQNGAPSISLSGSIGTRYQLESAPVIPAAGWTALTNLPLPASPLIFRDTSTTGNAQRFYRALAVP